MNIDVTATTETDLLITQSPTPLVISNSIKEFPKPSKINYPFVDVVRFVSMMGIVWVHIDVGDALRDGALNKMDHPFLATSYIQLFKFEVICFFLISGFLLGDNLNVQNKFDYFKRRAKGILKPYLLASVLYFITKLYGTVYLKGIPFTVPVIEERFFNTFFVSQYWFVPNYLICLAIVLMFSKHLHKPIFGVTILLITLIYTILTVYTKQYLSAHGSALLGFVFYLWAGVFIRQKNLIDKILKINVWILVLVGIALYVLSSVETAILFKYQLNYYSTLKIFNQLYSLSIFALLVRVSVYVPKFKYLNPRAESFGIYLYHGFIVNIPKKIYWLLHMPLNTTNAYSFVATSFIWFIISYITITIVVKIMNKYKIAYL